MLIEHVKPCSYLQNMVQLDCQYLTKQTINLYWLGLERLLGTNRQCVANHPAFLFSKETFPFVVRRIAWPEFN